MPAVFDREMQQLMVKIHGMCAMVIDAIDQSVDAFLRQDQELAQQVVGGDKDIDRRENTIDEDCGRILALNQPYAGDFRRLISIVKANHSLERMGDHAKSLSKCVLLNDEGEFFITPGVRTMARIVPEMVHGCVRALELADGQMAEEVRRKDKEVNAAYDDSLLTYSEYLAEHGQKAYQVLRLCEAVKHLERCADLAKNICKDVIYSADGKVIRHGGKTDKKNKLQEKDQA